MVTFLLFVRPALARCSAAREPERDRDQRDARRATTRSSPAAPTRSAAASSCGEDGWHATPTGPRARTCSPRCSAPTPRDRARPRAGDVARRRAGRGRAARGRSSMAAMTVARAPLRGPARARRKRLDRARAGRGGDRRRRARARSPSGRALAELLERHAGADGRQPRLRRAPRPPLGRRRRAGADPAGQRRRRRRPRPGDRGAALARGARARRSAVPAPARSSPSRASTREVEPARLRGLPRDGRGADRGDPRATASSATASRPPPPSTASAPVPLGEAERDRRRLGRPPRRGLRRRPRGDRPDQGRGADLEARGRGAAGAGALGRGRRRRRSREPGVGAVSERRLTHLDEDGSGADGRRRRARSRPSAARAPGRGCGCPPTTARGGRGAATRPKGDVLGVARLAGHPGGQAHRRADPAGPPAAAHLRRRRGARSSRRGAGRARSPRPARSRRTGVEMEAMTACAVAALTVYDMVKGLERGVDDRAGRAAREDRRAQRLAPRGRRRRRAERCGRRSSPSAPRGRRARARTRAARGWPTSPRALGAEIAGRELIPDDRDRDRGAPAPLGRRRALRAGADHRRHRLRAHRRHARRRPAR